ncbi:MAG: S8 family serine peptidase [Candidatus Daviesbacteria bacterium]|nr:S8 family serine peptidase [Candidatus Daviesbacteria bacterium]
MIIDDIIQRTNAFKLHETGLDGSGITVAILDSGIEKDHEFFQDITIEDFQVSEGDINDGYGHGTHVAAILVSIAPKVRILNIKVIDDLGESKLSHIMNGIILARDNGANLINVSVGIPFPECPDDHPLSQLIDSVAEQGIMIVCSAGNDGPKTSPHFPASSRNVIAVGSANRRGKTNKFSSHGPACGKAYPDCIAFGDNIYAAYPGNTYHILDGTSQASPQVTGMLALVQQSRGISFTVEEVEYFLSQSCDWIESVDKNNVSGWGIIDMWKFIRATELSNIENSL